MALRRISASDRLGQSNRPTNSFDQIVVEVAQYMSTFVRSKNTTHTHKRIIVKKEFKSTFNFNVCNGKIATPFYRRKQISMERKLLHDVLSPIKLLTRSGDNQDPKLVFSISAAFNPRVEPFPFFARERYSHKFD